MASRVGHLLARGDARRLPLRDRSVHCVVTSPPCWGLRDYGVDGQIGLEPTPGAYVATMVAVFREVRRVLRDDGTLWLNLGDSFNSSPSNQQGKAGTSSNLISPKYAQDGMACMGRQKRAISGLKPKDLVGIPWRVAFALQADGWYLRSDIIWAKPNPMPESVTDRPTKSHEYLFLLAKSERYFYDAEAIREDPTSRPQRRLSIHRVLAPDRGNADRGLREGCLRDYVANDCPEGGRNKRSVWTVTTQPFPGAHFATFPPKLIEPCILAGCPAGGVVLDPFNGAGTTGVVALALSRSYVGFDLNVDYLAMSRQRIERPHAPLPQAERPEFHPLFAEAHP